MGEQQRLFDPGPGAPWDPDRLRPQPREATFTRRAEEVTSRLDELGWPAPTVRAWGEDLPAILRHGLTNQHATRTSSGNLDPEGRAGWESSTFGDDYDNPSPGPNPVYGYIDGAVEVDYDATSQYGDVALHLSPSVNPRTTVTGQDSLGADVVPAVYSQRQFPASTFDPYTTGTVASPGDDFVEAQVHGGRIPRREIESATVYRGQYRGEVHSNAAEKALRDRKVPFSVRYDEAADPLWAHQGRFFSSMDQSPLEEETDRYGHWSDRHWSQPPVTRRWHPKTGYTDIDPNRYRPAPTEAP